MSSDDLRLRELWRERGATDAADPGCPDPERIWRAVGLEGSARDRWELVGHVAGCARCAESWRLAAELAGRPAAPAIAAARPRWMLPQLALAAATLVFAIGLGWLVLQREPADDAKVRATGADIRSRLEDGQALPRDRFLLQWTAGPPGTIYDVEVATTGLKLLARGIALSEPEFLVPREALADLPPGASIAWRVEATLPDGRVVTSVTHFNGVP